MLSYLVDTCINDIDKWIDAGDLKKYRLVLEYCDNIKFLNLGRKQK